MKKTFKKPKKDSLKIQKQAQKQMQKQELKECAIFPLKVSIAFFIGFIAYTYILNMLGKIPTNIPVLLSLAVLFSIGVFIIFFSAELYGRKHHKKDSFDLLWLIPLAGVIATIILSAALYLILVIIGYAAIPLLALFAFFTLIAIIFVALLLEARALALLRTWSEETVLKKK